MTKLQNELDQLRNVIANQVPADVSNAFAAGIAESAKLLPANCIKVGDSAPEFSLLTTTSETFDLTTALQKGPVVVTFFRGAWCPYCNLQLRALQQHLPEIQRFATLVAIAPQRANHLQEMQTTAHIEFPILVDLDNRVARAFGIAMPLPSNVRGVYQQLGIDLRESNGNDRFELPVPATYVIDSDRSVVLAFVEVDYTQRCEPSDIVAMLTILSAGSAAGRLNEAVNATKKQNMQ